MKRAKCNDCHRPLKHCLCACIDGQPTRLPILIVQHPDEAVHPFTTSYLAALGATSVQLISSKDISEQQCMNLLKLRSGELLALLYTRHRYAPHETITVDCEMPMPEALTKEISALIVLDGTWRNTRELILRNEWLARLKTLELLNPGASEYTIRKAGSETGQAGEGAAVCTIEAVARVLSLVEHDFEPDRYLRPFRELVRRQEQFQSRTTFVDD